jgi:hypothetical protein
VRSAIVSRSSQPTLSWSVIDTEDADSIIDLDQKWQLGSAHAGRFAGDDPMAGAMRFAGAEYIAKYLTP